MLCMNLNPLTASRTVFFVACLMSVASASWSMDLLQAYEAAKKHGVLKTPASGIRSNVINVYRLWCAAEGRNFIIKSGSTR